MSIVKRFKGEKLLGRWKLVKKYSMVVNEEKQRKLSPSLKEYLLKYILDKR